VNCEVQKTASKNERRMMAAPSLLVQSFWRARKRPDEFVKVTRNEEKTTEILQDLLYQPVKTIANSIMLKLQQQFSEG